jgi:hypothetical protein
VVSESSGKEEGAERTFVEVGDDDLGAFLSEEKGGGLSDTLSGL